jgi:hypothetical protein
MCARLSMTPFERAPLSEALFSPRRRRFTSTVGAAQLATEGISAVMQRSRPRSLSANETRLFENITHLQSEGVSCGHEEKTAVVSRVCPRSRAAPRRGSRRSGPEGAK